MRLALVLAMLAWEQPPTEPVKLTEQQQIEELRAENERLTRLLRWYQQQFFAMQAQQIEQQVAPKVDPPKSRTPERKQ